MFNKPKVSLAYKYWNGTKIVAADPMELCLKMKEIPDCDIDADFKLVFKGGDNPKAEGKLEKQILSAFERLTKVARHTFAVDPYEEENGESKGLLSSDCVALFMDFLHYMDKVKKKAKQWPIWEPSTASTSNPIPNNS